VLDEPTQGMDVAAQSELFRLIEAIRAETGAAVIMVSHDLHLVMRGTDRVLCLNGHICCTGHPAEVERDPSFRSLFGRLDEAAVVPYRHDHDHTHDGACDHNHDHGHDHGHHHHHH
jgi:zinc transport system ATP-binding protein